MLNQLKKEAQKIAMVKFQGQAKQFCFTATQLENVITKAYKAGAESERERVLAFLNKYTPNICPKYREGRCLHHSCMIEREKDKIRETLTLKDTNHE